MTSDGKMHDQPHFGTIAKSGTALGNRAKNFQDHTKCSQINAHDDVLI